MGGRFLGQRSISAPLSIIAVNLLLSPPPFISLSLSACNLSSPLFHLSLSIHSGAFCGVNKYFGKCGQSRKMGKMLYHMIDGLF